MQWYYALSGRQLGPVSRNDLQNLARQGVVRPDTLVWSAGMANWLPASQVRDLDLEFGQLPPPISPGVSPADSPYAPPRSSLEPNRFGRHNQGPPPDATGPLVAGIACTLFCCMPFGIVAVIYAAQISGKISHGDLEGARRCASISYRWSLSAVVLGFVIGVIYLLMGLGFARSGISSPY